MKNKIYFYYAIIFVVLSISNIVSAQTTEFTYQGKLTDGSVAANASYDFEFRLFDVASGGTALGTQTRLGVPVSSGAFTVKLDFAANFNGAARWLEIAVKPAGGANPFTVLTPRQPITSAPYSIKSLNAGVADTATNSLQLGGVTANQFVQTGDTRLTDARNPLAGSNNYIQNTFLPQQANASFNISGLGTVGSTFTANLVRSNTQFDIGLSRVLSAPGTNTFVGTGSGFANTNGSNNSFFGFDAGKANTAGSNNSFFGKFAGDSNTTGGNNSFFGESAGESNTDGGFNSFFGKSAGTGNGSGGSNSFFGYNAGLFNTSGAFNSFFGRGAGDSNLDGNFNSFFGNDSGGFNTTGDNNAFFGRNAGNTNTIGSNNTVIGADADVSLNSLSFATAIGAGAIVSNSNRVVIGRSNDTVSVPGGLSSASFSTGSINSSNLTIGAIYGFGNTLTINNSISDQLDVNGDVNISNGLYVTGNVVVGLYFGSSSTPVCHNSGGTLTECSSSLRYKTDVQPFTSGLDFVRRLRPITFRWKTDNTPDVGFGAEEVAAVNPLFVTYNRQGAIEGVKYGQITTVLLNAVKEQQAQIETQQENAQKQQTQIELQQQQLKQQQALIDGLRKLVCQTNPQADVCKQEK